MSLWRPSLSGWLLPRLHMRVPTAEPIPRSIDRGMWEDTLAKEILAKESSSHTLIFFNPLKGKISVTKRQGK